jgi:lipid A disaccharide synthetase
MLSADFLKTAQLLRTRYPDLELVVPLVNANDANSSSGSKLKWRQSCGSIC